MIRGLFFAPPLALNFALAPGVSIAAAIAARLLSECNAGGAAAWRFCNGWPGAHFPDELRPPAPSSVATYTYPKDSKSAPVRLLHIEVIDVRAISRAGWRPTFPS